MSILFSGLNVRHDDTRKLSEVLQEWKDGKTCDLSWRKIITVIHDPPLNEKGLANKICEFLARPDIMNEYLPSDQPGKMKMSKIDKVIL